MSVGGCSIPRDLDTAVRPRQNHSLHLAASPIWPPSAATVTQIPAGRISCELGILRRRQWHPTPVLLPGESHGRRSLVGCSPWGCYELDTTEQLHFHFSLSCIGEGDGNPLQCSCLENPRDRGAWWAAVSGVAQSQTRLKRLGSSSRDPKKSLDFCARILRMRLLPELGFPTRKCSLLWLRKVKTTPRR